MKKTLNNNPKMASKSNRKFFKLLIIIFSFSSVVFVVFSRLNYSFIDVLKLKTNPPPQWFRNLDLLQQEIHGKKKIKIGLVNVNTKDQIQYKWTGSVVTTVHVRFDRVSNARKWEEFFPASFDEDQNSGRPPTCPEIPMPSLGNYWDLDIVVAKLPCRGWTGTTGWRDVFRLQVNLVVANVLVTSGWLTPDATRDVYAVFIGQCGPMPEIFGCKDLLRKVNDQWVYMPELRRLKQKVLMPLGSCQLAPPFGETGKEGWRYYSADYDEKLKQLNYTGFFQREAYATVLHSSEAYVCGAIALAQSILRANSTQDLVLLHDEHITPKSISALRFAGWVTMKIDPIQTPVADNDDWNYNKLRIWMLRRYHKVIFLDPDVLVFKNIDWLFVYPQLSAAASDKTFFNSGVMVIEPSLCMFEDLMAKSSEMDSSNGGDQGFLNEVFTWWHRLPSEVNFLKDYEREESRSRDEIPDEVSVIHYLGLKPWMCYRDYDCNWDKEDMQRFASDKVHKTWWQAYDQLHETLQQHCRLTEHMNWRLKKRRWIASNLKQPDEHWNIRITDPRQYDLAA